MYETMDDVMAANEALGHHWFEADTMAFFKSKIETELLGGKYFISSEKSPFRLKRDYTIRRADEDGRVSTVGKLGEHDSLVDALTALIRLTSRG